MVKGNDFLLQHMLGHADFSRRPPIAMTPKNDF